MGNGASIQRRGLLAWLGSACASVCAPVGVFLGCGEAAAASRTDTLPLLLANETNASVDPTPYLVSEKFDGVRAFWDGHRLRFRSGREVNAPASFLGRLPRQRLDGELWLGRGRFESLSGLVRRAVPRDDEWRELRYLVFELPDGEGDFEARAGQLAVLVKHTAWPSLQAVAQLRLTSPQALRGHLDLVVRHGGEGLMLHRADAPYLTGRSDALLKLKPLHDADAIVIGHEPGRGKYAGFTGALRVRGEEGQVFSIGTGLSDAHRRDPPPIGSVVSYTHRGYTNRGTPRFASLLRLRENL